MRDETGSSALMRGSLQPDTPATAALDQIISLAGAASAISGCIPVRVSVSYRISIMPRSAPSGGGIARDQGVFVFSSSSDVHTIIPVSGVKRSKLSDVGCFASEVFEPTDADIAAFSSEIVSGIWVGPFGEPIDAFDIAYLRQVR